MLKDRSSLCIGFNSKYSMKIRQYVLFKIKNLPTRKLHGERNHSFYSENVWGSLPQSWGLRIFSLSYAREKTKRHLSLFLYRAQNLPSLLFYFKTVYILHNRIFGGCMLKIFGGHFVSTSSTARKTINTILMKLLR